MTLPDFVAAGVIAVPVGVDDKTHPVHTELTQRIQVSRLVLLVVIVDQQNAVVSQRGNDVAAAALHQVKAGFERRGLDVGFLCHRHGGDKTQADNSTESSEHRVRLP